MRCILPAALALLALTMPRPLPSQRSAAATLPETRADALLQEGRWSEAEDAFYAQSRVNPREPNARAALGRYLAMKGAVLPGTILIEEAQKFGLDAALAQALLAPWKRVLYWRNLSARNAGGNTTSALRARPIRDSTAVFQMPLPSAGPAPSTRAARAANDSVWVDVVPRIIGVDSIGQRSRRLGLETIELQVPSFDVRRGEVVLHADPRSALRTIGRRYPVLRDARDIRVLVAPGRALSLASALRELGATWWQLDLPHGMIVVRSATAGSER